MALPEIGHPAAVAGPDADPKARIVALAGAEGFAPVRVAGPAVLHEARDEALRASREGRLAGLTWMTPEWIVRATDPERFLPGARSVILCVLPYRPASPALPAQGTGARGRVAAYAAGRDYHRVFEPRLRRLAAAIRAELGAAARPTVDYGPLLERPLAVRAGAGWQGKSTMLLVPGAGPWTLVGAIVTDLALDPDPPLRKSCGSCTRCITACPTGALSPDGRLDARLCISYHTIENRGPVPRNLRARFGDWVFGCDDCLDACPVGWRHEAGSPALAHPGGDVARPLLRDLLALDEEAFRERFRGRAIARARREGLARNACVALGNTGDASDLPAVIAALADRSALVRGHAAWALGAMAARLGAVAGARAALEARLPREDDPDARAEIAAALAQLAESET